jgi:hypothetical protein
VDDLHDPCAELEFATDTFATAFASINAETLTFGTASFDAKNETVVPRALELLAKAESARRSGAAGADSSSRFKPV